MRVEFEWDLSKEKGLAMVLKAIHSRPFTFPGLIGDLAVLSIMAFHKGCRKL